MLSGRPSSWFKRLAARIAVRKTSKPAAAKRRGLSFEPLERRALLSVDILPTISGAVYQDVNRDGALTAADTPLAGVTVKLYRDGGNGTFQGAASGSDDTLVTSMVTDAAGKYHFDSQSAGTYFVQQSPATGLVIPTGQDVAKVVITSSDLHGGSATVIDSFDATAQSVAGHRTARTGSSGMAATEAIGGHRDLFVQLTSTGGSLSLGANADFPGILDFASGSASNGLYWVNWDGPGGDPQVLNPTGLGQVDLTAAGANTGIKLTLGADHDNGFIKLNIYSDSGNWSWASIPIPNTGDGTANQDVFVPFANFVTGGGSGANLAKVGAIQLAINGVNAVDGQVGPIAAVGPKVFAQSFANVTQADLGIVKSDSPDPVNAGGQLTYTLTATNYGPSTATGVSVSDTLPAGVTFASATTSQGTYTQNQGVVTFSLNTLANGATATATIIVTVNAGTTGTIHNVATITGNEPDPVTSNNTANEPTTVVPVVDLGIVKSDSPDPVAAGNQLTYTLTATNYGPSPATGVTVVDTLPPGVTYASATSSQGSVTPGQGTVTLNLGNLASGATATATLIVTVSPGTTGTITNVATITGNEKETNTQNNTASEPTKVLAVCDLAITKAATPNPVTAGNQLTYTLSFSNAGPSIDTGVTITDTLPAGVTYVSGSTTVGTISASGNTVTIPIGNFGPGASGSATIVVSVASTATGAITNTAVIAGNAIETRMDNNTAQVTTNIDVPVQPQGEPQTDLKITKTGPQSVTVGSNLTYTLTIQNLGPDTATGVCISDTVPAGLTPIQVTTSQGVSGAAGRLCEANIGTLALNGTATVTIVCRVDSAAFGDFTNTAHVWGDETDPDTSNNYSTWVTQVTTPVVNKPYKWTLLASNRK